eukprot:3014024-Rhodomonas_salina.1
MSDQTRTLRGRVTRVLRGKNEAFMESEEGKSDVYIPGELLPNYGALKPGDLLTVQVRPVANKSTNWCVKKILASESESDGQNARTLQGRVTRVLKFEAFMESESGASDVLVPDHVMCSLSAPLAQGEELVVKAIPQTVTRRDVIPMTNWTVVSIEKRSSETTKRGRIMRFLDSGEGFMQSEMDGPSDVYIPLSTIFECPQKLRVNDVLVVRVSAQQRKSTSWKADKILRVEEAGAQAEEAGAKEAEVELTGRVTRVLETGEAFMESAVGGASDVFVPQGVAEAAGE